MGDEVKHSAENIWPVLGLTGGIASGKTEACRILKELGAWVVDADHLAHDLVKPGSPLLKKIIEQFGSSYLLPSGELNRRSLNERIFQDDHARRMLEKILHPAIFAAIGKEVALRLPLQHSVGIIAAPLLIESGLDRLCACILLISSSEARQIERLMQRDGFTHNQALQRIQSQMASSEKMKRADWVIENDGSLRDLERALKRIWPDIKKRIQSINVSTN